MALDNGIKYSTRKKKHSEPGERTELTNPAELKAQTFRLNQTFLNNNRLNEVKLLH